MKVRTLAVVALAFLTMTCSQSPIFYVIATETAPKKPRIEGAPTNMVIFDWEGTKLMFVASGRLHWYGKTEDPDYPSKKISVWDSDEYDIPQPGGKIISLAITPSRLYALCFDDQGTNATLRYLESGDVDWTPIGPYPDYQIQSIYADKDQEQLFAGGMSGGTRFAIFYLDNANNFKMLKDETSLLSGVLCDSTNFYLCTNHPSGGFFQVKKDLSDFKSLSTENKLFMGMIKLEEDTIIAVARAGGGLYEVKPDSLEQMKKSDSDDYIETGRWATGALALWKNNDGSDVPKKLIAGIQGSLYSTTSSTSYSHGYVEFDLNSTGSINKNSPRREQGTLQSVGDNDRYSTSLGKHPINHLFQAPDYIDDNLTFFASTQTAGLWSYRDRPDNGGLQWNAEE